MSNKTDPTSTKPDTSLKATDTKDLSDATTGAGAGAGGGVGNTSNSIVDDLVGSVEGDELHNMSAQRKPQESHVDEVKK